MKRACRYVEAGIRTAVDRGQGNGPINHFHSTYTLPFSRQVPPSTTQAVDLMHTAVGSSNMYWTGQMFKWPGEDIPNMPSLLAWLMDLCPLKLSSTISSRTTCSWFVLTRQRWHDLAKYVENLRCNSREQMHWQDTKPKPWKIALL